MRQPLFFSNIHTRTHIVTHIHTHAHARAHESEHPQRARHSQSPPGAWALHLGFFSSFKLRIESLRKPEQGMSSGPCAHDSSEGGATLARLEPSSHRVRWQVSQRLDWRRFCLAQQTSPRKKPSSRLGLILTPGDLNRHARIIVIAEQWGLQYGYHEGKQAQVFGH